jgi:Uma2 family endonuclease
MASIGRPRHHYTYDQYVAIELDNPHAKHEFFDGEIYAMAGGTEDHASLSVAVLAALLSGIGELPCRANSSDLRIFVEAVGLATFPDGSVICGPLEQHSPSPHATAVNPMILVEVTSDSSEEYDTGEKLRAYQTIPTLREVIIISHRERRIAVHARDDHGWNTQVAAAGEHVRVPSLDMALSVDALYRNSSL